MLSDIVDIMAADPVSEAMLIQYSYSYGKFMKVFKELNPLVNITPKFHFLLHFPTIIRKNGPMRTLWTFNYERLNGKFKKPAHVMNNFKNPCKTLAFKRQCIQLYYSLSNDMFRDAVEVTNAFEMNPGPLGSSEIIQDILRETGKRSITVTDKVFVNGMKY